VSSLKLAPSEQKVLVAVLGMLNLPVFTAKKLDEAAAWHVAECLAALDIALLL
jgi:hypothetical protein